MELDMIVVLGLALLFFGGIVFLIWKDREKEHSQVAEVPMQPQNRPRPTEKRKARKA
jgi:hypothetical protein